MVTVEEKIFLDAYKKASQIEDKVLRTQVSKGFSLCKVV